MHRVISFFLFLSVSICTAQSSVADFHERWIVKLDDTNFAKLEDLEISRDIEISILSKHFNLVLLHSEKPLDKRQLGSLLAPLSLLDLYPDHKLQYRDRIPDDFSYSSQWNMDIIDMPAIWDHATGGTMHNGEEIVIAILDVGYEVDHIDLEENIWVNQNEIPNDNIDNDQNGYRDDYLGMNIDTQNDTHNIDDHGTKVAGIIGAGGNNGRGVAGVNWKVKLLPIGGVDHIGEIIVAMEYVIMMKQEYIESNGLRGANIVATNLSAGVGRKFPIDSPDWCPYYDLAGNLGILSVSAAPNAQYDVEKEGDLPSLCDSEYLIAVTNTDQADFKVNESGYGKVSIDLGAPGERVFTTNLNDDYSTISGTSASAPHVAGLIGLLYSLDCAEFSELVKTDPPQAAQLVKSSILEGVDLKPSLSHTLTKGRLNAYKAFLNLVSWCTGSPIGELELEGISLERQQVNLRYNTNDFSEHKLSIYNILGERLKTVTFRPSVFNERVLLIDLSDLDLVSGNYMFTLSNDLERTSNIFGLIVD